MVFFEIEARTIPNIGMFDRMNDDVGDFSMSCLPKSAGVFCKLRELGTRGLLPRDEARWMEDFDAFLLKHLPFFDFVIRQYYDAPNHVALQLRKLADPSLLERLDLAIAGYLTTRTQFDYEVAERLYFHVLEVALIRRCLGLKDGHGAE